MLMLFRHFDGWFTGSPCRDIPRGVDVCIAGKAAVQAYEFALALAVVFFGVAAAGTGAAGVTWINSDHGNTEQLPLVSNELTELGEGPSAHLCSLTLAEPCPLTDALEVFKSDPASSVFGLSHELLADDMVLVAAEAPFLVADPLHGPTGVLAGSPLVSLVHLPAQRPADGVILLADSFHMLPRDAGAVAGGDDLLDAKINAQKLLDLDWGFVGQVYGRQQVELAAPEDQVALALDAVKAGLLVLAINQRDDLPAFERQQACLVHALKAHQSLVVGHRPVGPEPWAVLLIPLEAFDGLADGADCHLAGQAKPLAKLPVAQGMDAGLTESLRVKANAGGVTGGGVELLHRRQQHPLLVRTGQQLKLQGKLHDSIIGLNLSFVNTKGGHSSVA